MENHEQNPRIETNHKIAVLIDYDNFNNEEYLKLLFDELNDYGDVIIKDAYFSHVESTVLSPQKTKDKFIEKSLSLGITPNLQLPYTKGKNASDIRIAIEAMDLLKKDYITCFCLASSDSDLTPLAIRLKKENKFVIGAGIEATAKAFKDACNYFINIDTRINDNKAVETKTSKASKTSNNKIEELVKTVNLIIDENKDEQGKMQFSRLIALLKKKQTDFSPKNYGYSNKNTLPFFKEKLRKYYSFEKKSKAYFISIKV